MFSKPFVSDPRPVNFLCLKIFHTYTLTCTHTHQPTHTHTHILYQTPHTSRRKRPSRLVCAECIIEHYSFSNHDDWTAAISESSRCIVSTYFLKKTKKQTVLSWKIWTPFLQAALLFPWIAKLCTSWSLNIVTWQNTSEVLFISYFVSLSASPSLSWPRKPFHQKRQSREKGTWLG